MANSRVRKLAIGMIVLPIVAVLVYAVHNVRTPESHAQDLASYGFTGGGNVPGTCCGTTLPDAGDGGSESGIFDLVTFDPTHAVFGFDPFTPGQFGNPVFWTDAGFVAGTIEQTRAYYGSGADGAVHLTTVTSTFNGGSCTAGACTLSRTGAYTNLTIDSGVTLATAGWGIYYTGTLALAGTISDDGSSGASGGAGAPHEGYGGGSNGGAGDSAGTGGAAGVTFSGNIGFGGTGGAGGMGGASGGTAGGAGGGLNNSISLPAQSIPSVDWLSGVIPGVGSPTSAPSASGIGGGAGGGGGGCGGTAIAVCSEGDGGQGGGGGGLMVLSGAVRTGAGAIHARGGAGQAGTSLGGAGGGGGGGTVLDICGDLSGYTGTIDENGGTGANPGANGQYLYIQG